MIIEVAKYLFLGSKQDLDQFFQRAQKLGLIEFISKEKSNMRQLPHYLEKMQQAIALLKKLPKIDEHISSDTNSSDIAEGILIARDAIEHMQEERRLVLREIALNAPFGDFSIEDVREIEKASKKRMHFYAIKHAKFTSEQLPKDLIFVKTDHDLDYYISLTGEPIHFPGLVRYKVSHSLSTLIEKEKHLASQLTKKREWLKTQAKYLPFLQTRFIEELDHIHLKTTKTQVDYALEDAIFSIQTWFPRKYLDQVKEMAQDLNIYFEEIAVEKNDLIPTCMENTGSARLGEDLVHIYDTPATEDKDPSMWVFVSFAIFFAMIIADAGYGFLYLLTGLGLKWKCPNPKPFLKRFIRLVLVLASTCIVWGILTTSFFGIDLKPNNPLSKFSLLGYLSEKKLEYHIERNDDVYQYWLKEFPDIRGIKSPTEVMVKATAMKEGKLEYEIQKEFNDNIMMELAILVGVIHITLSLLRNLRRSLAGLGWVAFLIGGYLYFPKVLDATTMVNFLGIMQKQAAHEVGLQLLGFGLVLALVLALIQEKLRGLAELFKMIEVFADVLSYLRLYALGLASMILAQTFNNLGQDAGFFFGILILLVGHATNIVLGMMAGVIHGLRLNFLEWYRHSFEGGGKLFNPLKLLSARS